MDSIPNIFTPLINANINQITSESNTSILKLKLNPNVQNDFIIANSNFQLNYLTLNPNNCTITSQGVYSEHKYRINDFCFFISNQAPLNKSFASADNEGNILIWDSRSKQSSLSLSTHGKGGVLSLDSSETILAAGYGSEICLWDLKTMKQIGKSSYAHSEAVTCVKLFNNLLVSSSEDNIINVFSLKPTPDRNLLNKTNVEMTVNLGQSIYSVIPMEMDYLSAITTVNTFHVVNLNTCTSQYEFDAKNQQYGTDYILDLFYDISRHVAEVFCGSYKGGIALFDFNLQNKDVYPYVNAVLDTGIEQTFNSIGRYNKDIFLMASDQGFLYVIRRDPK